MNADQVRTLVAEQFPEAMNSPLAKAFAAASEPRYTKSEQTLIAHDAETSRLYRAGLLPPKEHLARVLAWQALDKALHS